MKQFLICKCVYGSKEHKATTHTEWAKTAIEALQNYAAVMEQERIKHFHWFKTPFKATTKAKGFYDKQGLVYTITQKQYSKISKLGFLNLMKKGF